MKKLLCSSIALSLAVSGLASAQMKNPDTLSVLTFTDWSSFDPAYCYDTACLNILANTLESLVTYDGGNPNVFVPALAESLPTISNGGKTYTFKLRKGVKFADGSPLTAEDVEYTFERMMVYSTDGGPAGLFLEPLLGSADLLRKGGKVSYADLDKVVQTKGTDTVIFNLPKPFAPFLGVLAGFGYVYSKESAIKTGDWSGTAKDWEKFNNAAEGSTAYFKTAPLGTGPFMLERYDPAKTVILKRNDKYWRKPAALSRVIVQLVKDETTRLQMLSTGDADYFDIGAISDAQIATAQAMSGVVVTRKPQLRINALLMTHKINGSGTNYLGSGKLDGKGIPANFFSDKNLRKGFAYAMDYNSIIKDILQGNGSQQNSVMIKGLLGYNANAPKYKYDKTLATKYFKAAWGGKVWQNGFSLPVFFNSGNINRQRTLEMLKRNVESLNPKFKIEVRELPFAQILSQSADNKITLWAGGWGADYADPHNFAQPFLASNGLYPLNMNYKNPTLDKLIDQAIDETNAAKRVKLYTQIARIGFDETPMIPLYQGINTGVNRNWVKGRLFNPILLDYYYPISKK